MAKISFNVSAKTARLIGRENVSNLEGALIELIKNTYDADAKKCVVYYENSTNRLFIVDNGTGMNKDVLINNWMTIGNSTKKESVFTKLGRVNTGEKGIGRFALDRISEKCKMLTVSKNERFEWLVNWENFESSEMIADTYAELNDSSKSISDFLCDIKNKSLKNMIKSYFSKTGTCFVLENLRDHWNDSLIERVKSSLKKLLPPMENNAFELFFFLQNTDAEDARILPDLLNEYDYKIHFEVDESGKCLIQIHRNEFFFGNQFDKIMKKQSPSMDAWLKEAKADPVAAKVGMFLVHNGVVRETAKAKVRLGEDVANIKKMEFSYDEQKVADAVAEAYKLEGIYYIKTWLNEGILDIGDDIMYVLIGGDIRPYVVDALQFLVGKIKNECVIEKEII